MTTPAVILGQGDYAHAWPAVPTIEGQDRLTHSRMQAYKTCPRKHYYGYELAVRPDETAKPLRFGSAIHLGIDLYQQGHDEADCIIAATKPYEVFPNWATTEETRHDWLIEREEVGRLLAGYFWRWSVDGLDPAIKVAEIVASEQAFDIPIVNPDTGSASRTFTFAGKIDGIVRLGDGRLACKETKTCSEDLEPSSDYWTRLQIDTQISGYMHAAMSLGHDVQTVLYDVIRKPTIRPKKIPILDEDGFKIVIDHKTGERVRTKDGKKWRESGDLAAGYVIQSRIQTPEEYGEDLTTDIMARPDWYYARREIPRLANDLDEFRAELWQVAQQIREAQRASRHFRNTGACVQFNRRCDYLDCCNAGIDPENPPAGMVRLTNVHQELTQ